VRPPLVPLDEAQRDALLAALQARGFAMKGL
jgi:dihydrodipicolinate synthase/N-acetylneuraminate lyase